MRLIETIHSSAARRASYVGLLVAITLAVFVGPILIEENPHTGWVVNVFFLLVLISCLAAAMEQPRWFGLVIVVIVLHEILFGLVVATTDIYATWWHRALRALGLSLTAFILLRDVMRAKRVTGDTIVGAVCVYLLLGMIWAEFYLIVGQLVPGSFEINAFAAFADSGGEALPSRTEQYLMSEYLSFVTMTTLGYGDAVPTSSVSRSLALLQAIVGQFYIAIIVARLVAIYVVTPRGADGEDIDDEDSETP